MQACPILIHLTCFTSIQIFLDDDPTLAVRHVKGTVAWDFLVWVFSSNYPSWSHLRFPRAILNFSEFWQSYSSLKMTIRRPGHRIVGDCRCPGYRIVGDCRCLGYWIVKKNTHVDKFPVSRTPDSHRLLVSRIPDSGRLPVSRIPDSCFLSFRCVFQTSTRCYNL